MLRNVQRNVLNRCHGNKSLHKLLCSKNEQTFKSRRILCTEAPVHLHVDDSKDSFSSNNFRNNRFLIPSYGCQFSDEDADRDRTNYSERKSGSSGIHHPVYALAALSIFGLFKKEEVDMAVVWIHQAQIAQEKFQFDEANRLYHDALHLLIDQRKALKIEENKFLEKRTVIINGLANVALVTGRVREAEELFKDCMKGMLLCGMEQTDNAMVEVSLKLANVYARQNRDPEAHAGYNFCIKSQEKKLTETEENVNFSDTLALYGLSLDNFAKFLIARKNYATAEKYLLKALKVSQELSLLGEDIDHTTLIIQNNLATLLILREDYQGAHEHLKTVVNIAEKSKFPELATYYCNLGSVYMHQGRLDEAYEICSKSKKLAQTLKDTVTESKAIECLKEIELLEPKAKNS